MRIHNKIPAMHPDEARIEDFIEGAGITGARAAPVLGAPPLPASGIAHGEREDAANTALRLATYFGASAQFWLNFQARYEPECAKDRVAEQIAATTPWKAS